MTTLSIEIPQNALLEAVGQLDPAALNQFVDDVLLLRARSVAPSIQTSEADLRQQIETFTLSESEQNQLSALAAKSESGTMTHQENRQYVILAERSEQLNAKRIETIIKLAELKQCPVLALMRELGLANNDDPHQTQ